MSMTRSLLVLATLALPACFISQTEYQDALCDLDEDGDGDPRCGPSGTTSDGDCDDSNPVMFSGNIENGENGAYDGYDNDCQGGDLLDVDGDGFPGISREAYEALPDGDPWPEGLTERVDCHDLPIDGFPTGFERQVFPNAGETWYDGIDGNCNGDDDFDQDADGFASSTHAADYTGSLPATDCLDTDPDIKPSSPTPETPYDGDDQDCDGANDYDPDGDGHLTPGWDADANSYIARYGYDLTWEADADCMDAGDTFGGTVVDPGRAASTNLRLPGDGDCAGVPEGGSCETTWADGFDDACDDILDGRIAHNEFDQDEDGYLPTARRQDFIDYVLRYISFTNSSGGKPYAALFSSTYGSDATAIGAWFDANDNDCNDLDAGISPIALEVLGDGIDQDCDNNNNTARFQFGALTWPTAGAPRMAQTDEHHVLMASAVDGIDEGDGFGLKTARVVALSWSLDVGADTPVVVDAAPYTVLSSSSSLHAPVSVVASGTNTYMGTSWSVPRTRLQVVRSTRDTVTTANYRVERSADSGSRPDERSYTHNDLRCDTSTSTCWEVACDGDTLHFLEFSASSTLTRQLANYDDDVDAQQCFVLPSQLNSGTLMLGALAVDGSITTYTEAAGALSPATSPLTGSYDFVRSHGDWLVLGRQAGGLQLHRTSTDQLTLLTGLDLIDADAVVLGTGSSRKVTVVGLTRSGDVVLAFGTPSSLTQVTLPVQSAVGRVTPESVALSAGTERIVVAVSGSDTSGDRLGWMVVQAPE